jgi:N-acetylglucosaminyl-diphospho-decaprenol L-rhamnosyltransferase
MRVPTPDQVATHDVCAIVVAHEGRDWLEAALSTLIESAGPVSLDLVVVDNGSDGAGELVEREFPQARVLRCDNHGFGHANNRGLETADARYVLFLNPDTEVVAGSLAELVAALDRRPGVGIAGVRQLGSDGRLAPSIRRFPSTGNMLAEAIGVERIPGLRRICGELDAAAYAQERACDWTSGSFMLARSAALAECGGFDERFFLFSEETDLCWRFRKRGWGVVHLPMVTITHHDGAVADPRIEAQAAYARIQFAEKHFGRRALAYRIATALRYAVRLAANSVPGVGDETARLKARAALGTVLGRQPPPFEELAADRA